jgi:predicted secreted protein
MKRSTLGGLIAALIAALLVAAALWVWSSDLFGSGGDDAISFKGTVLTVTLSENPTTGYVWSYEIDGHPIAFLDDTYRSDPNPRGYDGVGGTHIFRFEGTDEGFSAIHFMLARSWEDGEVNQEFTLRIETGPGGAIISATTTD